jgi:hypothetical protein
MPDALSEMNHRIVEAAKAARKSVEAADVTFTDLLHDKAREMCPIDVGYEVAERNGGWALDLWWRE